MKYFWLTVYCGGLMMACQNHSTKFIESKPNDSTYTIVGKVHGLDSGWVYLLHNQSDPSITDSAKIDSGFFVFKGKASVPEHCLLGISNNGNKEFRLGFFVQNGQIKITAKKDSLSEAAITGSAAQDEYKKFIEGRKPLDEEEEKLGKLYAAVEAKKDQRMLDSLNKIFDAFEKKQQDYIKNYVHNHPSSYIGAFEVYRNFSYNPDAVVLENICNMFDTSIQYSYYGKKIKNTLEIAKKTAIGQGAPEFAQNNIDGKPVALSSFKGKYVLVDFWASWCGPCRAENPNVVKAFQKFHAKGFDILGVSLDEHKDKWAEAIKKDKLNWAQVSDLKGWKNSVAELYGVAGIPMNFLIDKNGKIIAKGLRGDDLEKKLAELL